MKPDTDEEPATEEITIFTTWKASTTVTVPKGFEIPDTLNEFPDDVLDQLDASNAELIDWSRSWS